MKYYDNHTEVLTLLGWKTFDSITNDDMIYTLDHKNHTIDVGKSLTQSSTNFNGVLRHYKSSHIDLLIPESQSLYYCQRDNKEKWNLNKANDIKIKGFRLKKDGDWHGKEKFWYDLCGLYKIQMDVWLEFLGYFLSEGSASHSIFERIKPSKYIDHTYVISIGQKKISSKMVIAQLLNKLPQKLKFTNVKNGFEKQSKLLYQELSVFGKCDKKYIPDYVWPLSKRQLIILFNALMLGDGTITSKGSMLYYTASKKLADDVQRLALLIGFSADIHITDRTGTKNSKGYNYNHKEYIVSILRTCSTPCPRPGWSFDTIDYKGELNCVENEELIYIRRNNKPCWN